MNRLPRFFIAGFLALGLTLPSPAAAHPELGRRALRPEVDRSGLEEKLSPVRPEPFDSAAHLTFPIVLRQAQDGPVEGQSPRAGLEELEALADQMYQQMVAMNRRHIKSLGSWDRGEWDGAWAQFDALYQKQLALLQAAGLLEHVAYPASGVDLRMIDASGSILLVDHQVNPARLLRAREEMERRHRMIFSDSFDRKISSAVPLMKTLEEALTSAELQSFVQDRSETRPNTLVLKAFSDWSHPYGADFHRKILSDLDGKLSSGDLVVVFDEDPQMAGFFRQRGYRDLFSGRIADALERTNRLLISLTPRVEPSLKFLRAPWNIYAGGLIVALAQPLAVLRKEPRANVNVDVVPGAAGTRTDAAGLEERMDKVARVVEEAADRGRVVVLSAATLEEQSILEAVISRFSGLEEQVILYGDSPAARELARLRPGILRAHTTAELSDAFGWLVARGPVEQVTYLGGLEEGEAVQIIAREWGLAFQVVPPTLVRLLAAFVPAPLAQTLTAGLEEAELIGGQV